MAHETNTAAVAEPTTSTSAVPAELPGAGTAADPMEETATAAVAEAPVPAPVASEPTAETPVAQAVANGRHDGEIKEIAQTLHGPRSKAAEPPSVPLPPCEPAAVFRAFLALPELNRKVVELAAEGLEPKQIADKLLVKGTGKVRQRCAQGLRLVKLAVRVDQETPDQHIFDLILAGRMAQAMTGETPTPSETLYGFAAWLTSREEPATFGAAHEAGIALDLVEQFCRANNLAPPAPTWPGKFAFPDESRPESPA